MKKTNYRLVEYTEGSSFKKGLFHKWLGNNPENVSAIIENIENGKVLIVGMSALKFLSESESEKFWSDEQNKKMY